jgi:hypothetical protein
MLGSCNNHLQYIDGVIIRDKWEQAKCFDIHTLW